MPDQPWPLASASPMTKAVNAQEITSEGQAALDELFPVVHNQALPHELLMKMQKEAYWRFYTKPRSVLNLARKLTNYRNAVKITRAISRRVFERTTASVN